jgi:hypothetical protein
MYLSAVIFLIIGFGSLAVAVVPGFDEWMAEQTLDATGATDNFNRFDDGDELRDDAVGVLTDDDIGGVKTTAWILAATFLPTAALFVFIGRWFKSMEPGFDAMMQTSAQLARNSSAMYRNFSPAPGMAPGTGVITNIGGGVVTGPPPASGFNDPVVQPPPG